MDKEKKRAYDREWRKRNKDKISISQKKYAKTHKEKIREKQRDLYYRNIDNSRAKAREWASGHKEQRREYILLNRDHRTSRQREKKYGLSNEEFYSMIKSQGDACAICKDPSWGGKSPYVDHDHKTGLVRGILCNNCNAALGFAKDNTNTIREMGEYLHKFHRRLSGV